MPNTMHSFENNSSNVPAFLVKLWKLVEDPSCNDLIAWSDTGSSFIIWNQNRFSKELLPQYFKHSNMTSFIRQLNMYGFHKVANNDKCGLRNETDEMEFQHHLFVKEMSELLGFIKRKIPNSRISSPPTVKSNAAKDILTDLSSIREKQQNMNNMLHKMKQENDKLWRELSCMRQKHKAQEQIIQKVIQFLVSIVQQNKKNLGVGVQRKMAPMLKDTPMNKEKSQVTHTVNALRNKNANFITADQNKTVSPLGPVIHEVTESEHEQEEHVDSPDAKSPGDKTDDGMSVPNSETSESDCPLNSSLDSPICTSANIELLSILKPLQQNYSVLNADGCSLEESNPNISVECLSLSNNMISISQETYDNVISLPDATNVSSYSYIPNQEMSVYTSAKSDFEDFMSESFHIPQIPTIHIEDSCLSPVNSENNQEVSQEHNVINNKYNIHNEHNYQLPLSNSLSVVKSSKLAKNTISNHLSDVDEVLKNIFRDISPNPLNTDPKQFLELISTDDIAKNEIIFGETGSQENNKTESSNIIGNELAQFSPSMFEYNLDDFQFFEDLNQDALVPTGSDIQNIDNQKNFLPANVLNNTDQTTASEAAEYLLNNGFVSKHKSPQRPKIPKQQKAKRRKVT